MHSQRLLNAGANRKILIDSAAPSATRRMQLLMARVASNRLAFPLEGVRRIEEVPLAKVERTGQREVLQYRGRIMNLLRLRQILGFPALDYSDPYRSSSGEAFGHHSEDSTGHLMPESICVVVCQMHHGETGLIIDSVEDIVEESVGWNEQEDLASSSILSASLVVGGRVADLVDLQRIEALAGMGSGMGRRA
jgi:two-component system, chemotaxis family, sensor kinase CheA